MTYEFVPQFCRILSNLTRIMDKAQTFADQKKFDPSNLLTARLAPDMFPFTRQVQIACDTAKYYAARLTDKAAPTFDDKEATIPELKQRIAKTIQYLETINPEDFKGWETKKTTNPRREGKYLPGAEFAMHHAIPNFYFHVTTAYDILRHNGVEIGKADYLGEIHWRQL